MAYGGATISSALVTPYLPYVPFFLMKLCCYNHHNTKPRSFFPPYRTVVDLTTQIQTQWPTYFDLSNTTHRWDPRTSLFAIWIGINDIGINPDAPNTFDTTLMKHYFSLVVSEQFKAFIIFVIRLWILTADITFRRSEIPVRP